MSTINEVTQGSLAKNNKLNEVIGAINSIANMSVKQGGEGEAPRFIFAKNKSELIITGGSAGVPDGGGAGGAGGVPDGYVETAVTLCQNGSPVNGSILFKAT